QAEVAGEVTGLPDNIGVEGELVTDSSAMQITKALEKATQNEIARIDIKEGNSWWVTRLLALSAGAVRAGTPKAIVFVGTRENIGGTFLGWGEPSAILKAILNDKKDYFTAYQRAQSIAKQVGVFAVVSDPLPPHVPHIKAVEGVSLDFSVQRYATRDDYARLGDAAFEQILMDQLALYFEQTHDHLTLGRLQQLFEHCLYRDVINLESPPDQQMLSLLEPRGTYIALARNGRYEVLLKREAGERIILRQLFTQVLQGK
ncbi:MAG TPA: hypothetical protein G4O11_13035, partial [Anaerolineae bacterium]|nr:hypothetical protein [Anaerolineae bacterium]